jgi:putative copper resistance protein D
MALLLDIFGFLSVVLRGVVLSTQSLMIGGVVFLGFIVGPVAGKLGAVGVAAMARGRRLLFWSALTLACAELVFIVLECVVLAGTMDIPLSTAFGAAFARFGLIAAASAAAATFVVRVELTHARIVALSVLSIAALAAQLATSHAAAQVDSRAVLLVADFLHMGAAAAWVGGIPYFLLVLYRTHDGRAHGLVGRRFSALLIWTVAVLVAAGLVMAVDYVGSIRAIYGTAYGVMVATKVVLLVALLFFGAMNNRIIARMMRDPGVSVLRVRRFAEVEIAIGFTVLFAAASLTSQPPAVDMLADRASLSEIAERMTPRWPRLTSPDRDQLALSELQARIDAAAATNAPRPQAYVPGEGILPPRNAADVAWSEYNHHLAGLLVLAIGLLALIDRTGKAPWARNWPLLFLLLGGFLWIKADPEVWPLGDVGFWASLRDPEVVQHRIFVLLIAGFAIFEWRVRTGRIRHHRAALVFPLIIALGAALMLTHSHALSNIKEQLLIELSHVPLALAGMTAGAARWLELRLDSPGSRIAGWVWPPAFLVVGLILLFYREA